MITVGQDSDSINSILKLYVIIAVVVLVIIITLIRSEIVIQLSISFERSCLVGHVPVDDTSLTILVVS